MIFAGNFACCQEELNEIQRKSQSFENSKSNFHLVLLNRHFIFYFIDELIKPDEDENEVDDYMF